MGLVKEGGYLVVYIPATCRALVFHVRARFNRGYEVLHYGPLPIKAGSVLSLYGGGTAVAPADGVMPGMSYVPPPGLSFPMEGAFDETDMWYYPCEWSERVFHYVLEVTPRWLRVDVMIPKGVSQGRFQRDKVSTGVETAFGFARGCVELVQLPEVHYGFRFGNDTNLAVRTGATFTYGEYLVDVPRDPDLVFDVLQRRVPAEWVTLPVNVYDTTVQRALVRAYGFDGFPLAEVTERQRAVQEYAQLAAQVKR